MDEISAPGAAQGLSLVRNGVHLVVIRLRANDQAPTNLEIRCVNTKCDFSRNRPLPVLTVDEPIYRRLPAFLIATVDKFAALPWVGRPAPFSDMSIALLKMSVSTALPNPARPAARQWLVARSAYLIIQDELHLIAGPLGTIAGLYEAAIDLLASRGDGENRVRPKIVASTATVRRAADQIEALFDRKKTSIFPPPASTALIVSSLGPSRRRPTRRDSIWASRRKAGGPNSSFCAR